MPTIATSELRAAIAQLCRRCHAAEVHISDRWRLFADRVGFDPSTGADGSAVMIFGGAEQVIDAATTTQPFLGFVVPDAFESTSWIRSFGSGSRSDITRRLWQLGWSVQAVERVSVPSGDGIIEFVVGDARVNPNSALDDAD